MVTLSILSRALDRESWLWQAIDISVVVAKGDLVFLGDVGFTKEV